MPTRTIELETYTIEPLVDAEGAFFPIQVVFPDVPKEAWEHYRARYARSFAGSDFLYTYVTCYLVRGNGRIVLVDGGIGPGPAPLFGNARGALLDRLAARGIRSEQVDTVILTHLHPDHVGWAAIDGRPTFPRARYVTSRTEAETFHRPDVREAMQAIVPGYLETCLDPLERTGVLETIDGETELAPGLRLAPAPGHTPGMVRVEITDGERALWIVADTFTHPVQVAEPDWCSAFDMIRELAVATRRATIDTAARGGIALLAAHFPPPFAGTLERDAERWVWRGSGA